MSKIITCQAKCFMDKLVIELPWLSNVIDLDALKNNYPYDKANDNPWRGVRCLEVGLDNNEMKEFYEKYHENKHYAKPPTYWLTHKSEETWISPHTDQTREAVLLFPITPKTHTINFLKDVNDSDSIMHSHTYKCPSIPHAKIPHCVFDKGIERWFLQISLYIKDYTWSNLVNWVDDGEIFAK